MKVGILTYHFAINYGAVLQAYALSNKIKKEIKGAEVEIIDLKLNAIRFTDTVRILPISKEPNTIIKGLKSINARSAKKQKFEKFVSQNFKLTDNYATFAGLKKNPPQCDVYICGSDQVWNPFITFGNVEPYLFEFVNNPKAIKASYAASLGKTEIKDKYKPIFKKALNTFDNISVRESVGQEAISKLVDKEVHCTLDPSLLMDKDEWKPIEEPISIKDDFILIYNMFKSEKQYKFAKKLKEETGCKIVELNRYGDSDECVDHIILDASPGQFLSYFRNAKYVLTNSFHGTAFSIKFQKQFMAFPSDRYNNRILNILEITKLDNQIYNDKMMEENNLASLLEYDVEAVKNNLQPEIDKSMDFIRNIFKSFEVQND